MLELGCGCGSVGIYAAASGAATVLLTDGGGDDLLQVAAGNAGRNHRLISGGRVDVRPHQWGELDLALPPRLDYVLGSDVTYNRQSLRPLCRSIRWLLDERRPRVVLAHEQRHSDGLTDFREAAAARGLKVSCIWREGGSGPAADGAAYEDAIISRGTICLLEVKDDS